MPSKSPASPPVRGRKREEPAIVKAEIIVELCLADRALTHVDATRLLGWQEEPPGAKWGDDYLLVDSNGKKIRCTNNAHNRPLNIPWAKQLAFDLLNRHWADSRNGEGWSVNGETVILGHSGKVLSAQHRLIGLKLASQEWEKQPHWKTLWPTSPPTMEAIVVSGVSELGEVVRTLDNTRPRSLSDVLFTEESVFGKAKDSERKALTKILDLCLKDLWDRTGASNDSFSPYRSHAESLDFLQRHPRVLKAVKVIWDIHRGSDKKGQLLSYYCRPGTAAALLYLMASSSTNPDRYEAADLHKRSDKQLDWGGWERACTFWSDLAQNRLAIVRQAIAALSGPEGDLLVLNSHRIATIVKAWVHYRDGSKLTLARITPQLTEPDKAGKRKLLESVECGGIDLGSSADKRQVAAAEDEPKPDATESEQIAEYSEGQEEEIEEDSLADKEVPDEEDEEDETDDEEEEEIQEDSEETSEVEEEAVEESNGEYVVEDQEEATDPEEEEDGPDDDDPSPEEIEEAAQQERNAREAKKQQQKARLFADRDARRK